MLASLVALAVTGLTTMVRAQEREPKGGNSAVVPTAALASEPSHEGGEGFFEKGEVVRCHSGFFLMEKVAAFSICLGQK